MKIEATAALLGLMRRLGCDPPLCHGCGEPFRLGGDLVPAKHSSMEGVLVHDGCGGPEDECMLPPPEEAARRKLLQLALEDAEFVAPPSHGSFLTETQARLLGALS